MIPTNAPTRWEVILTDGQTRATVRLTARHTKAALLTALQGKWDLIRDTIGLADDGELDLDWDRAGFCWRVRGRKWLVRFDRTEREIKNAA